MLFFKNKNAIIIGKVTKELRLRGILHGPRWKWGRIFFRDLSIDLRRMLNPHIVLMGERRQRKVQRVQDNPARTVGTRDKLPGFRRP